MMDESKLLPKDKAPHERTAAGRRFTVGNGTGNGERRAVDPASGEAQTEADASKRTAARRERAAR